MRLVAKRPFDGVNDLTESRWVSGYCQRMEQGRTFFRRKVQLPWSTVCDVDRYDSRNFFSKRLDSNYEIS